jgi:hypothetical protein
MRVKALRTQKNSLKKLLSLKIYYLCRVLTFKVTVLKNGRSGESGDGIHIKAFTNALYFGY